MHPIPNPLSRSRPTLADENILVIGGVGNNIREVAHSYGFKHVLTPLDLCKAVLSVYPFLELIAAHHNLHGSKTMASSQEV
jgi:hypothetical protein